MTEYLRPFKKCIETIKRQIFASNNLRNHSLKKFPYNDKSTWRTSKAVNCSIPFLKCSKGRSQLLSQLWWSFFNNTKIKNNDLLGEVQIQFFESFITGNIVILFGQTSKEFLKASLVGIVYLHPLICRIFLTKNLATIPVGKSWVSNKR